MPVQRGSPSQGHHRGHGFFCQQGLRWCSPSHSLPADPKPRAKPLWLHQGEMSHVTLRKPWVSSACFYFFLFFKIYFLQRHGLLCTPAFAHLSTKAPSQRAASIPRLSQKTSSHLHAIPCPGRWLPGIPAVPQPSGPRANESREPAAERKSHPPSPGPSRGCKAN